MQCKLTRKILFLLLAVATLTLLLPGACKDDNPSAGNSGNSGDYDDFEMPDDFEEGFDPYEKISFVLTNDSDFAFTELLVIPSERSNGYNEFDNDKLGGTLRNGYYISVTPDSNINSEYYNIRLRDENGDYWEWPEVLIKNGCEATVTYSGIAELDVVTADGQEKKYMGNISE